MMPHRVKIGVIATALACAPAQSVIRPTVVPGVDASARRLLGPASPGTSTPLSTADQRWVERTLASLTLREKIGQLMMPWVGGGYTAVGSPEFEQVRKWVQDDRVGGLAFHSATPPS